ncbi:FkbM family methyltransferase [Paludibaculum fermentans]|uniref:FkbM family methyltransferase n=1 Tax=Paludibaculum fermentans TaxID=1473598 RepID=UPI003EBA15E3
MSWNEFENYIHRKLLSLGWRVQREVPASDGWSAGRTYWDAAYLRRLGFCPATVIDVGVGHGTAELYRAFPDAFLLLIEPVAEFKPDIDSILAARRGALVEVALGDSPGETELYVEPRLPQLTSFYKRDRLEQTGDTPDIRRVQVETLDRVMAAQPCPRPFGLKIDAEGAELGIIHGATATLRETEFLIVEVSVSQRFEGGYQFAEMIAELDRLGFSAVDILDIGRADTAQVTFLDLVFQRRK